MINPTLDHSFVSTTSKSSRKELISVITVTEQYILKKEFGFPKTNGRSCHSKWFETYG